MNQEANNNEVSINRINQTELCPPAERGLKQFSAACLAKLQDLKNIVTESLAAEYAGLLDTHKLRHIVNEADALAAFTPFPELFLPSLAQEKAQAVIAWQQKQQLLLRNEYAFALAT